MASVSETFAAPIGSPIRVQIQRKKGWKMPPNTVCVTRASKWGNPHRIGFCPECGVNHTREEAIAEFRAEVSQLPRDGAPLIWLRGKNLACFCKLSEACHADVLLELANGANQQSPNSPSELQPRREGGIGCSVWLGRIVCGDNTEVLSGFPDACIDLVVTSPPYDDLRTYGGHSWNFETLAAQLVRVLKPGGVIVWVVADKTVDGSETGTSMRQALHFKDVCGLRLHDTMIYEKENPVPLTHNRYEQAWEYCFVMSKGVPRVWNPLTVRAKYAGETLRATAGKAELDDGHSMRRRERNRAVIENKIRGNVWRYTVGTNSTTQDSIAFEHPAVMPESLASDHIASWSNPGDVILDPFSGSGTTCKVAKGLNRQWCGIEINPEYCKIAEARLSQDVLQLETCAMRPNRKLGDGR